MGVSLPPSSPLLHLYSVLMCVDDFVGLYVNVNAYQHLSLLGRRRLEMLRKEEAKAERKKDLTIKLTAVLGDPSSSVPLLVEVCSSNLSST